MGENLEITNSTAGAATFEWDFCEGDIGSAPSASPFVTISESSSPRGLKLINDGIDWYAFVTSKDDDELFRILFGPDLNNNSPTIENLGNIGSLLDSPEDVKLYLESGNWYALIFNSVPRNIVRVDFGSDLSSNSYTVTEAISGVGDSNTRLEISSDQNNIVVFLTNFSGTAITQIDFGSSILNNPTMGDVSSTSAIISGLIDIDVFNHCDRWYGITISYLGRVAYLLDFGTSLLSDPATTLLADNTLFGTELLSSSSKLIDQSEYNFLLATQGGTVFKLNIGDDPSTPTVTSESLGDFGLLSFTWAHDFGKDESNWYGFSLSFISKTLTKIEFPNNCSASEEVSTCQEPTISFGSSGTYNIGLRSVDANGNQSYMSNSVFVSSNSSPLSGIDFGISRCISTPNTFTPSLLGLSYTWDFGDGSMPAYVNDEIPTHQYSLPGTYTIRLDINDGTCNNFTEQEITIYPDPPTPTFTAPTNECKNALVSFMNTTDESLHIGVLTYEWDFNGEGTSTDVNPTFAFTTPGTKQITLKTLIPGCENTSSIFEIEVSDGPTSAFSPSSFSICEGETVSFTDASTNTPVSWSWGFDDGFTSMVQNPDHLFSTSGSYDVALTVTDALGCQSTLSQEVSVSSLPVVSFDFDVACTSADGVQFMDLSTVSGASIVSRTWYVGDTPLAEAQDQQNPLLSFATEGTVNVRLETVSSNGCEASHSEDIQILAAPQPEFSMNIGCQGEESLFTDLSASPGNQVTTWLWSLDGTNYATEDINHTFSGAGMFDVTLEVTGQNFCSETITKSIEVLELLTVDFQVNGDCSNEVVELSDQSLVLQDPIVSREWSLDGSPVGNGSELALQSLPDNTYEVMLEVTTASGCIVNTSNSLVINRAPESSISGTKTFGVPGDEIAFSNESTGGSSYHWLFNGDSVSDNSIEETFAFPDAGTYEISMVSNNDLGCSDTAATNVLIAIPSVDLSVGQFEIVNNDDVGTIFLEIQNNSNLPIDNTEVAVELENQFSITEQITSVIEIGESELVSLSIGVPLNVDQLSYLCVRLNSQYKEFEDSNPLDNEKCLAIQPRIVIEAPFPNPVRDQVRVRLVAPEESSATLTLLNSAGKVELEKSVQTQEGLNNFFLDLKALTTGIYFIQIQTDGTTSVQRIIKL